MSSYVAGILSLIIHNLFGLRLISYSRIYNIIDVWSHIFAEICQAVMLGLGIGLGLCWPYGQKSCGLGLGLATSGLGLGLAISGLAFRSLVFILALWPHA